MICLQILKRAGVRGGTIIESTGMIKTIDDSDESYLLGSLRLFLENPRPESRTIFFYRRRWSGRLSQKNS